MLLSEFLEWRPLVENYWSCKIDEAVANCVINYDENEEVYACPISSPSVEAETLAVRNSLKSTLVGFMGDLETQFSSFFEDPRVRTLFMRTILSLGSYIVSKNIAVADDIVIPDLVTLPNEDTSSLFGPANQQLPYHQNSQLFTIEETTEDGEMGETTTTYELLTDVKYDNLMTLLSNLFEGYEENVNNLIVEVGDSQLERGIYMLSEGKDAEVTYDMEVSIRDLLLDDYGVQDVLDRFQWTIKGLNA